MLLSPLLEFQMAGFRLKVFDIVKNHRDKCRWFSAPARFGNIDFSGTSHSVFVEISIGVSGFLSTIKQNQSSKHLSSFTYNK